MTLTLESMRNDSFIAMFACIKPKADYKKPPVVSVFRGQITRQDVVEILCWLLVCEDPSLR